MALRGCPCSPEFLLMHFETSHSDDKATNSVPEDESLPWWKALTGYHWFVFIVAALAWLFDTMDQQLFTLARKPAIMHLIKASSPSDPRVDEYSGYATAIFMVGWALGGVFFGILGDRVGRARTLMITILLYSAFTGLSALSVGFADFSFYRFLTGLGVGGVFAVAVSLVAEVMPDRSRTMALGWLQALSAFGNMLAAVCGILLGKAEESGAIGSAWRAMFVVGVLPALLSIFIFVGLEEPDKWKAAAAKRKADKAAGILDSKDKLGSLSELFGDPRWRRNTIVGMLLAFAGVVGLWGIGFFTPDLVRSVFNQHFTEVGKASGKTGAELAAYVRGQGTLWTGINSLLLNLGAFFGIYAFSRVTQYTGRKPAFALSLTAAMITTAFTFWFLKDFHQIFWMIPLMGFCQLATFGGYAIYFPELFPTRLRSTGTSFCYNVGRLVAASGPLTLGLLTSKVYGGYQKVDPTLPFRYAGVTMCAVFQIGLLALPFAPETQGKPLPE
jgi:MFS family permease